jgi:hypothetical protein
MTGSSEAPGILAHRGMMASILGLYAHNQVLF